LTGVVGVMVGVGLGSTRLLNPVLRGWGSGCVVLRSLCATEVLSPGLPIKFPVGLLMEFAASRCTAGEFTTRQPNMVAMNKTTAPTKRPIRLL
jgi:hypothetical protein